MNFTRSSSKLNMQHPKAQTAGWAAFDRIHGEKQGNGAEGDAIPFPSFSKITSADLMESSKYVDSGKSLMPVQFVSTRLFSSVVRPSTPVEFPLFKVHRNIGISSCSIDGDQHLITVKSNASPVERLKGIHNWADQHLIEDILAAVNNDVGQASLLLNEMISPASETKIEEAGHSRKSSSVVICQREDKNNILTQSNILLENELSDLSHKELIMKQFYVSHEPEWEEDDVYLSNRKEAMKMMRAALRHSRAASIAYLRGDHLSAQQLSLRAREERITSEQLNSQAAEEILCVRNSNNGMWKLDLHGLHAKEAVVALKHHLERIESKMMMNRSASSDGLAKLETIQRSPSFDSLGELEKANIAKMNLVPQQRQALLHVITGTGNHSKGEAALPAAVKSFLIDNRYRFDDARPGVISVRPKFRLK